MNLTPAEISSLETLSRNAGVAASVILRAYNRAVSGARVNAVSLFLPTMRYNALPSDRRATGAFVMPKSVITHSGFTAGVAHAGSKGVRRARSNGHSRNVEYLSCDMATTQGEQRPEG